MHYRKDIQILRGIAVVLVVLFHLEIAGLDSGFLGVDIFFVISGYLMAILYDSNDKSTFFKRRIKRLLPTYFVVIFLTMGVSIFVTIPNEYNQVMQQTIYATLFSSNIGYWLKNSYFGYAEFNPLLHLWSLGVEIQFYLFVPILAWFLHKSKVFFLLLSLGSLFLCFSVLYISPKTSFFMMPFRLWEFLIGYGAAIYFTNNGNIKYSKTHWAGLVAMVLLITIPTFNIDGQAMEIMSGHPGFFALLISLSTGIILIFGIPKILEMSKIGTGFEILGKYSYSIYLVHFPIIVLFLYKPFSGTILSTDSMIDTFILLGSISFLSILMFRYIEEPLRKSKNVTPFLVLIITSSIVILFMGKKIQAYNYSYEEQKIFNAWEDRDTYRCGKIVRILHPFEDSCLITQELTHPKKKIYLVGNSHADSIKKTFAKVSENLNVSVRFVVSNIPLMEGSDTEPIDIINEALKYHIDTIVLHYSPNAIEVNTIIRLVNLAKINHLNVVYIMPVPVWKNAIPKVLYNHMKYKSKLPVQSNTEYNLRHRLFYNKLHSISDLDVYTVDKLFCENECLFQDEEDNLYYFDDGHLTLTGSKVLEDLFIKIINNILID